MRMLLLLISALLIGWLVVTRLLPSAPAVPPEINGNGLPPLKSVSVPGQALERARQVQDLNNQRQAEAMKTLP